MRAHKLKANVQKDHQLHVELPEDFPPGPVEVIVLAPQREDRKIVRMAGVLGASLQEVPAGDPIAEALDELREERAKQFDLRLEALLAEDDSE